MQNCKNDCEIDYVPPKATKKFYVNGYKYCSLCNKWWVTEDIRCKCCGTRLRVRAR